MLLFTLSSSNSYLVCEREGELVELDPSQNLDNSAIMDRILSISCLGRAYGATRLSRIAHGNASTRRIGRVGSLFIEIFEAKEMFSRSGACLTNS